MSSFVNTHKKGEKPADKSFVLYTFNEGTPQPNRSKVFELQQSNQGYGESLGVKVVQKNAKQKYSIELFWRNLILKFTL